MNNLSNGDKTPSRMSILFHPFKTIYMVFRLLTHKAVPFWRKLVFCMLVLLMVSAMIFPDLIGEVVLSTFLPIVGTIVGIPIDAGLDWAGFALVSVYLFRCFPREVVEELFSSIF
jgi:hypothetical protein